MPNWLKHRVPPATLQGKQVEPPGYFEDFSPRADNFIFESFVTKLGTHKLYVDAKLPRVLDVPILIIF